MGIYNSMRFFLTVGQLSGLAPFSMYKDPMRFERNCFWELITWFWCFANLAVIVVILSMYRDMIGVSTKSALSQALLFVIIIMNYLHTCVALVENFFKRDLNIRMLNILLDLNDKFNRELELRMDYNKLRKTYRKGVMIWFIQIVSLGTLNVIRYRQDGIEEITNFSVFFMPTYVFGALSYVIATTVSTFIRYTMSVMAIYLEDVTKEQIVIMENNKKKEISKWEQLKKLKPQMCIQKLFFIKRSYNRVWEIALAVSNSMYLAMPIGCVNEFLILVFNGYWLFLYLLNNRPVHILFYVFVGGWGIGALTNLIYVANSCTNAVNMVEEFQASVHRIPTDFNHDPSTRTINHIVYQSMHQRIGFLILDFLDVDYALALSIVGATATYLIILIQFN